MADFKPVKISGTRVGGHLARTGPPKLKPKDSPQEVPDLEQVELKSGVRTLATDHVFEPPNHRLPPGWVWMWNRLGRDWEYPFDNIPQMFGPFEFKPITEEIAGMLWAHCIIDYSSEGGAIRCLSVEGDEGWCLPLEDPTNVELINREDDDNPVNWGTGGEETRAVAVKVPGAKQEKHSGAGGTFGRAGNTSKTFTPAIRKGRITE